MAGEDVVARLTERDPSLAAILPKDLDDELREAARELIDALDRMVRSGSWHEAGALDVARARMRVLRALGEAR